MGTWKRIDSRNPIAVVKHFFHMFGDMCEHGQCWDEISDEELKKLNGRLFNSKHMAISGKTAKYIADHLDFLEERCKMLGQRIQELERINTP